MVDADGRFVLDLFDKQMEVIRRCEEKGKGTKVLFVNGPKWTGKCVSPDTIVFTADGIEPIGSMGSTSEDTFYPIDRTVIGLSANRDSLAAFKADQFYNSGTKPANRLTTEMGYELTCSLNHPIWTEHNGDIRFRTSEEIRGIHQSGGEVWMPMARRHPGTWTGEFQVINGVVVDSEVAYLMGLLVGDGCYTKSVMDSRAVRYSGIDSEIIESFRGILKSKFDGAIKKSKGCDWNVHSRKLRDFLRAAGMAEKYAHEKTCPDFVFKSPKNVAVAFLQGLFDTDGTVSSKGDASYCSSSPILAKQVQSILLALGVRSTRLFKKNRCRGGWHILPREEDDFRGKVGFRLTRKQVRPTFRKRKWKVSWAAYPPSMLGVMRKLHASRKERGVGSLPRFVHKTLLNAITRGHRALSAKMVGPMAKVINCEQCPEFQAYWMQGDVWWTPLKSVEQTTSELVDISVPSSLSFVGNGFLNHNTVSCLNAVVSHAWNTKGARVNIVVPSITAGDDSGVWSVLTEQIIPEWIDGDFGFDWWTPETGRVIRGPRQKGGSKKLYCEVTNKFGTKSHIEMNSLKDERDVEKDFFNRYFTMIYWGELQNFRERHTFDTMLQCLRLKGHHEDDFVMLCDGNPSDLGTESWMHKLFYQFRLQSEVKPEELPLQKKLQVLEIYLDDNTKLSDEKKMEIKSSYAHDPDLYDRYILGKWVKASTNALFLTNFKPSVHIIGDSKESDPEMLVPQDDCMELFGGWDHGSANPAFVIAEKLFRTVLRSRIRDGQKTDEWIEESVFKFIDELIFVKSDLSVSDFTELAMEKITFWEKWLGREVAWTHWSDRSAFDQRESISNRYVYEEVYSVSGGKILLQAHEKSQIRGTKAPGIRLWKKLLFQDRLFFSAAMTPQLIEMNKVLRRDMRRGMPMDSVDKGQNERHAFDSARYLCASECWNELQEAVISMETDKRPEPKLMTVRL